LGKKIVKDGLDASSGASLSGSTKEFDVVRFDSPDTKKPAIPVGLRGLLLYPISDYKTLAYDDLKVSEQGKVVTVRYVHRGVAYELTSDGKENSTFFRRQSRKDFADNVGGEFVLKPEYVKAGGDPRSVGSGWSKVTLRRTKGSRRVPRYEGTLSIALIEGVQEIKEILREEIIRTGGALDRNGANTAKNARILRNRGFFL
jgi:hypothetical protein